MLCWPGEAPGSFTWAADSGPCGCVTADVDMGQGVVCHLPLLFGLLRSLGFSLSHVLGKKPMKATGLESSRTQVCESPRTGEGSVPGGPERGGVARDTPEILPCQLEKAACA